MNKPFRKSVGTLVAAALLIAKHPFMPMPSVVEANSDLIVLVCILGIVVALASWFALSLFSEPAEG